MLDGILDRFPDIEFTIIEGFEDCVRGVVETTSGLHILYSLSAVYDLLIKEHGCEDKSGCDEWYYHNMLSLTELDNGPFFLEDLY